MKEQLLNLLAPVIKMALKQVLTPLLDSLMQREPEHGAVALATLYPIVDAELEPLTERTGTEFDDAAVDAVKEVIQDVAGSYNVPLSDVDGD